MNRGVWWRLEGEALRRREQRRCATEGHPSAACFWQAGDYATLDKLMCGRCFMTIATRPHGDGVQRIGPTAGATDEEE